MFDRALRTTKDRALEPAARLATKIVGPLPLTMASAACCVGAGLAAAQGRRWLALALWLGGRTIDGLDGTVARLRHATTDLGGYLDILLDTVGYAAVPLGVAWQVDERATWMAVALLLGSFYVNAISWAYLSAVLEKRSRGAATTGESTAVTMPPGLVEGAETIVMFSGFLVWPQHAAIWFVAMAIAVGLTVVQRIVFAARELA
jgi:phosphatidylglycerophosphate synthase